MKLLINEGQTLPVNPELYKFVVEKYKSMFEAYLDHQHKYPEVPDGSSKEFTDLWNRGGIKYLKKIEKEGLLTVFLKRQPLNGLLDYSSDAIIPRRISKKQFHKRLFDMENSTISLAYFINNSNEADEGYFYRQSKPLWLDNMIVIRFSPFKEFVDLIPTIRHELQHFTQSFYAQIFGLDKWIGLGPANAIKGQDPHGNDDMEHQDIPVEMHTDVQDEIHEFLELIDDVYGKERLQANPGLVRQRVMNFLNLTDEARGEKSSVFYHYFLTNKVIWKWAVNKLLTAVEAYLK